jgi:hypothetical protein
MYLRTRQSAKTARFTAIGDWCAACALDVGVIQQTVTQLGDLDERDRLEARAPARHLVCAPEDAPLFDDGSRDVAVPVRLKGIRI